MYNKQINVQYVKDQSNIFKFQVQLRHISIQCVNGRRTVVCCTHIAVVIYYLSYTRYLTKIPRLAQTLNALFKTDEITTIIEENSDKD